jgi:SWI/SNF-related matrix-associated actin-dependent regulator 1 of chromatin subfamily A
MSLVDRHAWSELETILRREWILVPAGRPRTIEEFSMVLALAALGDLATVSDDVALPARVQLAWLGLGKVVFTPVRAKALLTLVAGRRGIVPSIPVPAADVAVVDARVEALWKGISTDRAALSAEAGALRSSLLPSFGPGRDLKPYQWEAVAQVVRQGGRAMLGDEMGLGKTMQAIAALSRFSATCHPVLVVAPTSMTLRWEEHLHAWLPDVTVARWGSPADVPASLPKGSFVAIVAWEFLTRAETVLLRLSGWFRGLIVDEAQQACNLGARRTKRLFQLTAGTSLRLLLSGTFSPNERPREAWTLLRLLDPAHVPPYTAYARHYCGRKKIRLPGKDIRTNKNRWTWDDSGKSNEVDYADLLRRHLIRRLKTEISGGGLPSKTRHVVEVEITNRDRTRLAVFRDRVRFQVAARVRAEVEALRIRRVDSRVIASRIKAIEGAMAVMELSILRKETGLVKVPAATSLVRDLISSGERPVCFAYHLDVARAWARAIEDEVGPGSVLRGIDLPTPASRRDRESRWESGEAKAFVVTRKLHAGVTLVSGASMVFIERWLLPGEEAQGEDRVHRIGQTRDVHIHYLHARGTVDDVLVRILDRKEGSGAVIAGTLGRRFYRWISAPDVPTVVENDAEEMEKVDGEGMPMESVDAAALEAALFAE